MSGFKDRTFCASPDCKNECGRKMTNLECVELDELNRTRIYYPCEVSYGYFCGEPEFFEEILIHA